MFKPTAKSIRAINLVAFNLFCVSSGVNLFLQISDKTIHSYSYLGVFLGTLILVNVFHLLPDKKLGG